MVSLGVLVWTLFNAQNFEIFVDFLNNYNQMKIMTFFIFSLTTSNFEEKLLFEYKYVGLSDNCLIFFRPVSIYSKLPNTNGGLLDS